MGRTSTGGSWWHERGVRHFIEREAETITRCYHLALRRHPYLRGRLRLTLQFDTEGHLVRMTRDGGSLATRSDAAELLTCIEDTADWYYPYEADEAPRLTQTFWFRPCDGPPDDPAWEAIEPPSW